MCKGALGTHRDSLLAHTHTHTQSEPRIQMYINTSRFLLGCIHYTDRSWYFYTSAYGEFGEFRCYYCVFSGVFAVDLREWLCLDWLSAHTHTASREETRLTLPVCFSNQLMIN